MSCLRTTHPSLSYGVACTNTAAGYNIAPSMAIFKEKEVSDWMLQLTLVSAHNRSNNVVGVKILGNPYRSYDAGETRH